MYFLNTRENVKDNLKNLLNNNNNIILNKLIKSRGKCNPKLILIFLLLFISGIVIAGRNNTNINANIKYVCHI